MSIRPLSSTGAVGLIWKTSSKFGTINLYSAALQVKNLHTQLGAVNFPGCKIDTKLTYNYLRSLESKISNFVSILFVVIHN